MSVCVNSFLALRYRYRSGDSISYTQCLSSLSLAFVRLYVVARHFTHVSFRLPNKMDYILDTGVLEMVLYQQEALKNIAYCLYLMEN